MTQPTVDRPLVPEGYGLPEGDEGTLPWSEVEGRLQDAPVYWMATTRPDGRPHVIPRWGVWLDGRLYYDGSPQTRHARNLLRNPHCVLHLESGTQAVIIEGRAGPAQPPTPELGGRLAAEFTRKYGEEGYAPEADAWEGAQAGGLCIFSPERGLAWTRFPTDATRYRFHP